MGQKQKKKHFPLEIINNKIIFLRTPAEKYMPSGKKKDFHLNYMYKTKILHS